MSSVEIREYLETLEFCAVCILRYQNSNLNDFENVQKDSEDGFEVLSTIKRPKRNICIACLNIFHGMKAVVEEVIENSALQKYAGNFFLP